MMMRGEGREEARGMRHADELLEHLLSVTVKSAITPSFIGRTAWMLPGTAEHLLRLTAHPHESWSFRWARAS